MTQKLYNGIYYLNVERLKKISTQDFKNPSRQRARNILKILERYEFKCVRCLSKKYLTIDHLEKDFNNRNRSAYSKNRKCQVLCVTCHLKKNKENGNTKRI